MGRPVREKRAEYLGALADGLRPSGRRNSQVEVIDTGNTITKMRADVSAGIDQLLYFAGLGYELKGQTIPSTPDYLHMTLQSPMGWWGESFRSTIPIMFAIGKLGPRLMAGNAVIVKPSSESPLSACILAEVCREVLPPGLVNIVTGSGGEVGDAIVRHPRVKRIALIGSVETGMAIQRAAAESAVKHITLELGGKNPMILFPTPIFRRPYRRQLKG